MAVVPSDELGGGPGAAQVLAGNPELPVGLRADGVDHRVVQRGQLAVRHVATDLDVSEEAKAGARGDLLERARDGLQLRVVGRDAQPDEPPRRREPLDHVDLDRRILARKQCAGGVERSRPGPDDGDAQRSSVGRHRRRMVRRDRGPQPRATIFQMPGRLILRIAVSAGVVLAPRAGRVHRQILVGQPPAWHVQRHVVRHTRLRRGIRADPSYEGTTALLRSASPTSTGRRPGPRTHVSSSWRGAPTSGSHPAGRSGH